MNRLFAFLVILALLALVAGLFVLLFGGTAPVAGPLEHFPAQD